MEISKNLNREEIEKKANSFMRGVDNHKIWGSHYMTSKKMHCSIIKHLVKGGNRNRIIIYPVLNGTEREWERLKICPTLFLSLRI